LNFQIIPDGHGGCVATDSVSKQESK